MKSGNFSARRRRFRARARAQKKKGQPRRRLVIRNKFFREPGAFYYSADNSFSKTSAGPNFPSVMESILSKLWKINLLPMRFVAL